MDNDQVDTAVGRWLQRPYVLHRFRAMGPQMTNVAVLALTMLLQASFLVIWYFSPVEYPILWAFIPVIVMASLTAVFLQIEPVEQRKEVA